MKNILLMLSAAMTILTSCSSSKQQSASSSKTDTLAIADTTVNQILTARMVIKPMIQPSDSIALHFTVYNTGAKAQTFCKWHTPFEAPMSKYLDITDEQGNEAQYQGAMAKRIMPPPASSYITVRAGDSLTVTADLRKSYKIDKAGKYTVRFNAQEISGLSVKDSITFEYGK
jgi:hypothetical protein